MPDHIRELLYRNLQEVFGEGNAARRRAVIEDLYTEDCVLYAPPGIFVGPKPSTNLLEISAPPTRTSFTPRMARPGPAQCRASGVGIGAARRAAQLHGLGCGHRSRWKDRGALCVPRSRTVVEGDLFAGAACGAVKPRPSSRPLWGNFRRSRLG
jgi:hypothetical protein